MSHDTPTPNVPIIHPRAVFTVESATATLNLADTCILREIRRGRLRASRRAGRYWILGSWLLRWLAGGTSTKLRRRAAAGANGKHDDD
jgi:hypothetical protein